MKTVTAGRLTHGLILQEGNYSNKTIKIIPSTLWPGNAVRKQKLAMQCQTSVK